MVPCPVFIRASSRRGPQPVAQCGRPFSPKVFGLLMALRGIHGWLGLYIYKHAAPHDDPCYTKLESTIMSEQIDKHQVEHVAERDNVDTYAAARHGFAAETALNVKTAFRLYPYGCLWSIMLSAAIIMEGYGECRPRLHPAQRVGAGCPDARSRAAEGVLGVPRMEPTVRHAAARWQVRLLRATWMIVVHR
jgi:hypothetical protein